jgi:AcrR family transcriptional regulator
METTKKAKRKSGASTTDKILAAYRQHVLTEGKQPSSVFVFCQSLGIPESTFYDSFGSFEAIDKAIWKGYFDATRDSLAADKSYSSFTLREKILAFYFTLAEVLKGDRSFAIHGLQAAKHSLFPPAFIRAFQDEFTAWLNPILNEGKQQGEVATRPMLDTRYDKVFLMHLMFILQFWSHDDSPGFEKTDAAIEKSVNLAVDLIGKGILDNALDFGKFLFQNAR